MARETGDYWDQMARPVGLSYVLRLQTLTRFIFEEDAKPYKLMQSFLCPICVSYHRVIIKLPRPCIVNDVRYHSDYRARFIRCLILFWQTLPLTILLVRQRMSPKPLNPEFTLISANQRCTALPQRCIANQQSIILDALTIMRLYS